MMKQMKKYVLDLAVVENICLHPVCYLLKLTADERLPEMIPGQFVEVRVDDSPTTFLRRPISIHYFDKQNNELWLLIQVAGAGTHRLSKVTRGETLNVILPLGNGFSMPQAKEATPLLSGNAFAVKSNPEDMRILLIGGGIGVAPLLFLADTLQSLHYQPEFLLGARTCDFLWQFETFDAMGVVYVTTEDGSLGKKGFVTFHPVLQSNRYDKIYACGPQPMMEAVAKYAKTTHIDCEVSLENRMACGIGACLCCVERTVNGHVCVCTEGPVFNINQLTWQT